MKIKFSKSNIIFYYYLRKGDTEEKEQEDTDENMKEAEGIQEENQEKKTVEAEQTEDDDKDGEDGEQDDSKGQEMVSSLIPYVALTCTKVDAWNKIYVGLEPRT